MKVDINRPTNKHCECSHCNSKLKQYDDSYFCCPGCNSFFHHKTLLGKEWRQNGGVWRRAGVTYTYFCNDECYANWLNKFDKSVINRIWRKVLKVKNIIQKRC